MSPDLPPQMPPRNIGCFKAYDVRGRLGIELDEDVAYRIGRAFAQERNAETVIVGRDSRASSPKLAQALIRGLTEGGADVRDLGLAGTEEMYFATAHFHASGGIEVTASHNPIDYNGMKLVGPGAAPLDPDTEFAAVAALAQSGDFAPALPGKTSDFPEARAVYAKALVDFIDITALRRLTVLVNAGNGTAGPTFDAIAAELERRGAPCASSACITGPIPAFPMASRTRCCRKTSR